MLILSKKKLYRYMSVSVHHVHLRRVTFYLPSKNNIAPHPQAHKGEPASTPEQILAMVKEQCAPRHRIILFLQQSSVEWASSMWLPVVQEVDPALSRTIIVASKFDNRLKEFGERWEVDKYLGAGGYLPREANLFFIALPKACVGVGVGGGICSVWWRLWQGAGRERRTIALCI